jgi:hypothetical protein
MVSSTPIRVLDNVALRPAVFVLLDRFTFSPSANLIPGIAPGKINSLGRTAKLDLDDGVQIHQSDLLNRAASSSRDTTR